MDDAMVQAQKTAAKLLDNVQQVIIGKGEVVELAVIALISKGHLLIEDAPGVGKTMLARSLARSLDCTFRRIQFTPDMLPGDITGVSVYNQKIQDFEFRPGPIMAQMVLTDEINRATPKVQSALLECMEEGRITVDGVTHQIPSPFHVLATQNPIEYEGTFPLPETQLDRFLMRIHLGYPSHSDEIAVVEQQQHTHPIENIAPVATGADLLTLQTVVKDVYVDDLVKQYIVSLVAATRDHPTIYLGASPRGSLALFRTTQARALVHGRDYVLPDDVKALAEAVLAHRLIVRLTDVSQDRTGRAGITELLETIPVPGTVLKE
ncbi:MAG: MoxR family ATPase [Dehalococcoidales bacterium]|nr:MAG: MoxR family ATPase [Dehalococcoidales bacterium]